MHPLNVTTRLRQRDDGMSLMEVVVAVVLLGVLSTLVVSLVLQAQAKTVDNRSRVAASNLAAREIDIVRETFMQTDGPQTVEAQGVAVNLNSLNGAGNPSVVDGQSYTVRRSVSWNVTGSGKSACEGGALVKYPTMSVRVEVTWPGMGSIRPVVNTTHLAPPKGTGNGTTKNAYVAVRVTNASGGPNPGRTVTVTTGAGGGGVSGVTDDSGCAVVQVTPAASGTEFVARLGDAGYVDQAGNPAPSRSAGILLPGSLSSAISIAYDKAVTLDIRVGGDVTAAEVAGASAKVYKGGGYVGSSPITEHPLTGLRTLVSGLWPGDYAAYIGASLPTDLELTTVSPGSTAVLEIQGSQARVAFADVPWGADVIAAPAGSTSCTDPGARKVATNAVRLLPGTWTFFAKHNGFGCSPGPADESLTDGDNGVITWAPSSLAISGAPAGYDDTVWAVSNGSATATCQAPPNKSHAVKLGSAPDASADLPAGDWYVFVTKAQGNGPSSSAKCASAGLVRVGYDEAATFTWPADVPGDGGRP